METHAHARVRATCTCTCTCLVRWMHLVAERVAPRELLLIVGEQPLGVVEVVRVGHAHRADAHDRDVVVEGGEHLEDAPRPLEHAPRLHEHEHVALLDVRAQVAQVLEVVRVEEGAAVQLALQHLLQVARLGLRLRLAVRDEGAVALRPGLPLQVQQPVAQVRGRVLGRPPPVGVGQLKGGAAQAEHLDGEQREVGRVVVPAECDDDDASARTREQLAAGGGACAGGGAEGVGARNEWGGARAPRVLRLRRERARRGTRGAAASCRRGRCRWC